MKCPVCPASTLQMSERAGVEVDYCPTCRGVWLDRGELDKIIARSSQDDGEYGRSAPTASMEGPGPAWPAHRPGDDRRRDDNDDSKYGYPSPYGPHSHPPKKRSLLKELFDF